MSWHLPLVCCLKLAQEMAHEILVSWSSISLCKTLCPTFWIEIWAEKWELSLYIFINQTNQTKKNFVKILSKIKSWKIILLNVRWGEIPLEQTSLLLTSFYASLVCRSKQKCKLLPLNLVSTCIWISQIKSPI